ncbi:MucBP domain-containing protein [Furfurilactobacillus sp. WILCCON 0119]|uniref:MucBP domain-containing protein n=1 Tax=Furfurilactobacillus entadae TaxID=2922307 RepID=UPI0035E6387A
MNEQVVEGIPVWVYYTDVDSGDTLLDPKLVRGNIGDHYTIDIPEFANYRLFRHSGDLDGVFSTDQQEVRLFFRTADWAEVEKVHMYATIQEDLPTYDQPDGELQALEMPIGSVWRVFSRIATDNGEFWYNMGINQWVMYKPNAFTLSSKSAQTVAREEAPLPEHDWDVQPIAARGAIDFVDGQSVSYYSEPYGRPAGTVPNRSAVIIEGEISDPSGVVWFQLQGLGFINSMYVKLTGPINISNS